MTQIVGDERVVSKSMLHNLSVTEPPSEKLLLTPCIS